MNQLFIFGDARPHDLAVEEWLHGEPAFLYAIARRWFGCLREQGEDVSELIHDGYPVACVQQAAFGYVNVFRDHVNVGFYTGAFLPDPAGLLEGSGKRMRHVKLRPDAEVNEQALSALIGDAYADIRARLSGADD